MHNSHALVSVIVPTYNRADIVCDAIRSILNQTYRYIELIVVDDGSTDDTQKIIKQFNDPRIHYIYTDNWGGPARPRNIGIRRAKGDYIAFCDADDSWAGHKLEYQLKYFDNDDIIGVGTAIVKIGDLRFHRQNILKQDLILGFNDLLLNQTAALSSLVVRNNGFYFDENESYKFVEDFEFQLRIALETKMEIKVVSEPLTFYRIHSGNESKELSAMGNVFAVLNKYKDHMSKDAYDLTVYRKNIGRGIISLSNGNRHHAAKYFTMALKNSSYKRKLLSLMLVVFSKLPSLLTREVMRTYYKARNLTGRP